MHKYFEKYNELPNLNNLEESIEIIKITGKYAPIQQWLRFDYFETVDNLPDNCYREFSDIGKSKSLCARRESKKINKNFNWLNLNYLVNNTTINIFNDDFWEK